MKKSRKSILLIVLSMMLCFGIVSPVHARGLRIWIDDYLLPEIPKPRGSASYVAELQVETQNGKISLEGTCTLEAELTDKERVQAVMDALDAVPEYDDISDAAEDQKDVKDLRKELNDDLEDPGPILKNFIKCSGFDKVYDLLRFKLPSYDWDDVVKMFIDTMKDKPATEIFSPVPLSASDAVSGAIIGTVKVSWAEYKKDQKRWQDIVELANASARLRVFDNAVKYNLRQIVEKKKVWTIKIQNEYTEVILYDQMLKAKAPMIHTADIVLKKSGDADSPFGTYTGTIMYKGEVDLKEYDNQLPEYYAGFWAGNTGNNAALGHFTGVGVTINRPSENILILEQTDFSYNMKKEDGFAGVYDTQIDTGKMEVKDFHVLHDYAVTVQRKEPSGTTTITQTNILDSVTGKDHKSWLIHYETNTGESYDTTEEANNAYPETDPRQYLKMKLVISKY